MAVSILIDNLSERRLNRDHPRKLILSDILNSSFFLWALTKVNKAANGQMYCAPSKRYKICFLKKELDYFASRAHKPCATVQQETPQLCSAQPGSSWNNYCYILQNSSWHFNSFGHKLRDHKIDISTKWNIENRLASIWMLCSIWMSLIQDCTTVYKQKHFFVLE